VGPSRCFRNPVAAPGEVTASSEVLYNLFLPQFKPLLTLLELGDASLHHEGPGVRR
jgi:hypothetical protein